MKGGGKGGEGEDKEDVGNRNRISSLSCLFTPGNVSRKSRLFESQKNER